MPFARVGAMPQPTNTANSRNGRQQKGITMEDLKKQTAIRLAQEHKQPQPLAPLGYQHQPRGDRPFRPLAEHQLSHTGTPGYHLQNQEMPYPAYPHQQQHHNAIPVAPHATTAFRTAHSSPQGGGFVNYHQREPYHDPQNEHRPTVATRPSSTVLSSRSPARTTYPQEQRPRYNRGVTPEQYDTKSSSSASTSKHKLPHGLTVHELKAMTQARLQAEAADRHDPEKSVRGVSPLDFEGAESRERSFSHDSGLLPRAQSIPSLVQTTSADAARRQSPSSMHHQPQQFSRMRSADAWETGSVASHNTSVLSENLSESAFSAGFGSTSYPMGGDAAMRERSFTTGHMSPAVVGDVDRSFHSGATFQSSPFFDAAVGGNRRRACTLSPRNPPGLIHEHRPHFDESAGLGLPNVSSNTSARGTLTARLHNTYSPMLGLELGLADNRPRAISLPVAHMADNSDNRDRAHTYSGYSVPSSDNAPTSLHEGLAGFSMPHRESGHVGLRDGPALAAPPGFGETVNSSFQLRSFSRTESVESAVETSASPWENGSSFFGSSRSSQDVNALADQMGSILQLSGAGGGRPDRERSHTYPATTSSGIFVTDEFLNRGAFE